MSATHWIRSNGQSWYIPHGRITLNIGTENVAAVTCKVCLRIIARERAEQARASSRGEGVTPGGGR